MVHQRLWGLWCLLGHARASRHRNCATPLSSGPSGKFCNAQPRHKHCGQGAVRREWQALSKGCNTAHDACGAALREPLCECDSVLRFLPREGPLPAKRALIRTRTVALNVTELSTWPTSGMLARAPKLGHYPFKIGRSVTSSGIAFVCKPSKLLRTECDRISGAYPTRGHDRRA